MRKKDHEGDLAMTPRKSKILILASLVLALSASVAAARETEVHGTEARKLREERLVLEAPPAATAKPEDDEQKILHALSVVNSGPGSWKKVSQLQDPDAKSEYMREYILFADRLMEMVPEEDPVLGLMSVRDLDKPLFAKELEKLPPAQKDRILKRLKEFNQEGDTPPPKSKKKPVARDAASDSERPQTNQR